MHLCAGPRGPYYQCLKCRKSIGAHHATLEPKGTPADHKTRQARKAAHKYFDRLWLSGRMTRRQAYRWLSHAFHTREAHIGQMDIRSCTRVIRLSARKLRRIETKR
jgi:hypothetical protein